MSSLAEFLLARIAEDKAGARAAKERAQTPWRATYGRQVETCDDGYLVTPEDEHSYLTDPPDEVALHIARHDPARILAECEAKRRIVIRYVELTADESNLDDHGTNGEIIGLGYALGALALPYADHPDYHEEWKPCPAA